MGLETATSIAALNALWPLGGDPRTQGDDHLRLIKSVLKADVVSKKSGGTFDGDVAVGDFDTTDPGGQGVHIAAGGGLAIQQESAAAGSTPVFRAFLGTTQLARLQADGSMYLYDGVFRATGSNGNFTAASGEVSIGESAASATARGVKLGRSSEAGNVEIFADGGATASRPTLLAFYGAAQVIRFQANGTALNLNGVWGTISDAGIKTDIEDAGPQLADLLGLRLRRYRLQDGGPVLLGFVAQEVAEVKPGLVEEGEDGLLAIKSSILVPALVGAVQELAARVLQLEAAGDGAAA